MLDFDILAEQSITDGHTSGHIKHGTFGAEHFVRQNNDLWHGKFPEIKICVAMQTTET
jgi:hypothetical protein